MSFKLPIHFFVLALLAGLPVNGLAKEIDEIVVVDVAELQEIFIDHQLRWLPISPPTPELFVQSYDLAIPIRWKFFPKAFCVNLVGELNEDCIPIYRMVAWEDPVSYETVFSSLVDDREIYRLPKRVGYDPYAWQKMHFNAGEENGFVPNPIYSQSHIGARFVLVPSEFYEAYVLATEQHRQEKVANSVEPLAMMAMNESGTLSVSLGMVDLVEEASIDLLNTEIGSQYEIYFTPSLIYPRWVVARANVWGGSLWRGCRLGQGLNSSTAFFRAGAMVDNDNDGVSSAYEVMVLGTDPSQWDSDDPTDGINDGDEDFDGDGLSNFDEYLGITIGIPSSPQNPDTDGDGICDGAIVPPPYWLTAGPDAFPLDPAGSKDTDGDGLPDEIHGISSSYPPLVEDLDDDNDRLSDIYESANGLDPKNPADGLGDVDADGDGLGNLWEDQYGYNPSMADNTAVDSDGDGLSLADEYLYFTNPNEADTDGDGVNDALEVAYGYNPNAPDIASRDVDGDGLTLLEEAGLGTHPTYSDSDGDQLNDGDETIYSTNPLDADTDEDGLFDGEEVNIYGTNPNNPDSDGDGTIDSIQMLPPSTWGEGTASWRLLGK